MVDNLDVMMNEEMKEINMRIYKTLSFTVFTVTCLLLLPVMLIRNFNRIKILGVIITILNVSLILQVIIYYIYDTIVDN